MKQSFRRTLFYALACAAPALVTSAAFAEPAAPAEPNRVEIIASLIDGLSGGAGQQCREIKDIADLGSPDDVKTLCGQVTACIATAMKASEALQNEAYDAFRSGAPPGPKSIPQGAAMITKCMEPVKKALLAKSGNAPKP